MKEQTNASQYRFQEAKDLPLTIVLQLHDFHNCTFSVLNKIVFIKKELHFTVSQEVQEI